MKKSLVTYFSASGVTAKLAKRLANAIQADTYEIRPQRPYTNADLNWMDKNSRSTLEMKDPACRPAITLPVPDVQKYDVVFVGFPVWWYREPSIIDTFMEACDFTGKKVVPFATSGTSGIGDSGKNMQKLASSAIVETGKRLDANLSETALSDWAKIYL
ncbi:MAG: flavodoxin [Elusimicrobiaceae bacterium]|nr:flavodoxin [Elusimicrobiaceae bacterium]